MLVPMCSWLTLVCLRLGGTNHQGLGCLLMSDELLNLSGSQLPHHFTLEFWMR
jgi:hypothetical protein